MTKIVGHRGARNIWPENSLTGFRNVLALDVDAIEFDVHLTDAGELVVIHDATLDRTTDKTGPVRALTSDARATTHLEGSSDTVPTLADVLAVLAQASGKQLHVEIKSDEANRPYPGITQRVVAEIERFDLSTRCHLTSFDVSVLEECRRAAPQVARLVSVNAEWARKQGGLERFLHSVEGLADIVAIHHDLMSAEWTLITQHLPLARLGVWTLNDEALIRPWLERGIGHLTSDSPDLALRLCREIQSQTQPA
ncbi:glycerophosphodiester phosphodiesterase family protein [Rhizobium skierniewicense]|uniref:glycerophosphodiester phosphodiesterase family protein n=1 Tax=Rhizobium skierniewicense TaxID=984260 RepID=UPI001572A8CC|nr:glycerophosphodiester phosphodiesterase family protein [Rhizobium skierniewicense]NTF33973.1 glycerophosphodiester phosphodiesterase [Rhizobium skierniewicense]